jgi:LAGLIDADG DNA endonuclease family protein
VPQYRYWLQVAGYFDGDGTIYFSDTSNQPYKLSISLVFVDQSLDQMKSVKDFLNRHRVKTSNILKRSDGAAYELAISQFNCVKRALRHMIPYLSKKEIEARAALDYYEGRITGNQLWAVFKAEVDAGRRERHPRKVPIDVPYTHPVGDRIMKGLRKDRLRDAIGRYRAKLTVKDFQSIRTEHFDQGKRICDLVREYPQYARETIRRVLGRGRGYILVKGIGRVITTDITLRDPRDAQHS